VLGSVLAMVIAVHFGLAVTLATGAAAYLAAMVVSAFQGRRSALRQSQAAAC